MRAKPGTFQAALATAERLDREAQSLDTTTLLAHLSVMALDEYGYCECPRCERQHYDRGSCSTCNNVGWLDQDAEPFTFGSKRVAR